MRLLIFFLFVAVSENADLTTEQLARHVAECKIPFPVLRDEKHAAAEAFKAQATPEAFVLDGVSFSVRPGEKIAIVGPSGAGKSTVFHLLLRFYDCNAGTVALDGVRVGDCDPRALRRRVALVPQDVAIFAASVA